MSQPTDAELAITQWVQDTSDDLTVVWGNLNGPVNPYPYVLINRTSSIQKGAFDRTLTTFDPTRARGSEIEVATKGQREAVITVEVFTNSDNMVGDESAYAIAEKISSRLRLPGVRESLQDVGMFPFAHSTVINLTKLIKVAFEGRAQFDVRFYTMVSFSEFTGYIRRVKGSFGGISFDTGDVP